MKSNTFKSVRSPFILRFAVLIFLLVLVVVGAVPGYWTGNWSWATLPQVTNINQIRELRQTGLELPGWRTVGQKTVMIGGHQWSVQQIQQGKSKPIGLLLLPQSDHNSQPQVEWMDIDGLVKWKTDSYTKLQFEVEKSLPDKSTGTTKPTIPSAKVEARFFRAWTQRRTVAVLQWYAWSGGGNPAPSRWFFADQLAQLRRNRVPWVAVCLQIPIEPLGDIEASRPLAESLGKIVQFALMQVI
ncbi:MAG: cyanoexosortase B system-associated protein [Microcoleus sp. SIO2G3]|nr:cyanoexosortase B system-associated protein [Microcoleus sp. SIO2G3]